LTLEINPSTGVLSRLQSQEEYKLTLGCHVNETIITEDELDDTRLEGQNKPDNKKRLVLFVTGIFDRIDDGTVRMNKNIKKRAVSAPSEEKKRDPRDLPSSSKKKPETKSEDKNKKNSKADAKTSPCHVSLSIVSGNSAANSLDDKIYDSNEDLLVQARIAIQSDAAVGSKNRREDNSFFILRLFLPPFVTFKQMARGSDRRMASIDTSISNTTAEDLQENDTDHIQVRIRIPDDFGGNSVDLKVCIHLHLCLPFPLYISWFFSHLMFVSFT